MGGHAHPFSLLKAKHPGWPLLSGGVTAAVAGRDRSGLERQATAGAQAPGLGLRSKAAATIPRRMPSINQLVRKGRVKPKKKVSTPGLKSGQGRKRRIAAPQRRGVCTRVYTTT